MASDDAYSPDNLGMPLFLLVSMLANAVFISRACKDVCGRDRPIERGPAIALLTCAISELTWVVPCFIQCAMVYFMGHGGRWSPTHRTGCDIMGFYSQFGSLCSMLATLLVAVITCKAAFNKRLPSKRVVLAASVSIFTFCTVISLLPIVGATKPYALTDGGFCYIDWFDTPQAVIMLIVCLPTMAAVLALFGRAFRGEWEKKLDLLLLVLGFLSAWVLWPPAGFIGLAGGSFPAYYMIAGGVAGHAQALINPYIYGMRWREAMCRQSGLPSSELAKKVATELTAQEEAVGETPPTSSLVSQ